MTDVPGRGPRMSVVIQSYNYEHLISQLRHRRWHVR